MAQTASIAGLQAKLWYKDLFADVPKMLFMNRFMGEGTNNPVQIVRDLTTKPGHQIEFGLSTKLANSGISGDSTLEGNEEAISSYSDTLAVNQLRHAVLLTGRMDEKKVAYSMRTDAKEKLKIWWAETIDQKILRHLAGNTSETFANTATAPTANRSVWAGGVSADNSLTAAMKMDTKVLDKMKQLALLSSPKVRPIRLEGEQHMGKAVYPVILHPYQMADLRLDPVWNQAQRDANVRGNENPILSGANGIYNGLVIYEHELAYTFNNSGAVACARAVLLGQQAGIFGIGEDARWVEKSFDYGNQWGISAGRIFGIIKPVFNSEDYGVITAATAATALSTA